MTADYDAVFNDIMGYALKNIGEPNVKTKQDLLAYIKESDARNTISGRLAREMVESRSAEKYIAEPSLERAAIKKELSRPEKARLSDESKTAKKVTAITEKNFKAWKKNPAAFDLRGIDTKTHSLIRAEIKRKVKLNIEGGYSVRRRGQRYYRLENDGKRARDLITGRFVKRK